MSLRRIVDVPDAGIPPKEVERRLEELRALYKLGLALREVRFLEPESEARDVRQPDSSQNKSVDRNHDS